MLDSRKYRRPSSELLARVKGCCRGISAASIGFGFSPSPDSFAMTDSEKNQHRLVDLAYERSSEMLRIQAEIANVTDQRALVFATLSVAAGALVFDALNSNSGLFYAIGPALFFCLAAFFATFSAIPGKLHTSGSRYIELQKAVDESKPFVSVVVGLCQNNDVYIAANERAARWRAHCYRFAICLFIVGLALTLMGVSQVVQEAP